MRVAGIDCGTNSIRLLIADVPGESQPLDDVTRRMEVARLGQGVDRTGHFDPQALERTLGFVDDYARQCREHGVESIRFAATSATRDAANRDLFLDGVKQRLGVDVQVLSGDEEARASFTGATAVFGDVAQEPFLTVDLGGGSTELVLGLNDGTILGAASMNVGCVRMRERHFSHDPVTDDEIARARADVQAALDSAALDLSPTRTLIGLAGTITTITAKALDLPSYDPAKIHGALMSLAEVDGVCEWFIRSTAGERAQLPFMHPGRVDVIHSGALVWQEVIRRVAAETAQQTPLTHTITSEHDILDGLALWAAREPNPPSY
ncbi:exopolyphosphatase/guanosine-5'-triphosphate,3'-diphosphate pyrophosphatase [Trueperella bonasi]|uniref:Exopolyphosphatase/guanosine-5'-triphosphate, 3'-diphosphate pyrophosphatase n=1 Tax=Trueperella bonasi TaxID=312286 RepID=A0ABT9NFG3_9ACTO|nr:Ppx/GppA phosphatase family protein [Trueperella bonasi]MDP9806121.1 exopolyphosphatase/guanosine-5'-triphosphate,3'-diphosphate pyrophosphatase [Trueperella bonasi]